MSTSFFSNIFGQRPGPDEPSASVLAEWNKYSNETASPSASDRLASRMEEGGVTVQNLMAGAFARLSTGVQGVGQTVGAGVQTAALSILAFSLFLPILLIYFFLLACRAQSSMPNTMNFTCFLALLGAGLLFSILAFTLFLPIIILAPSKFAICFTIGSALIMSAFVSLRGWKGQLAHMFSAERVPFTAGYLGSMGGTLYAAMGMHSYILTIVCCGAQVVALLYYTISYFPGGTNGVYFVMKMAFGAFTNCLRGMQRVVTG